MLRKNGMLSGKRINLRLIRDERECRILLNALNDLEQRGNGDHTELKHPCALLKKFAENGLWDDTQGKLLLTDKDDRILGTIGFSQGLDGEFILGYRLLKREDRGKGFMSEGLSMFSAYLFATWPIYRLRLHIAADNVASRKLADKCGYRQEGVLRNAYFYRGRRCDFIIYGLLREECVHAAGLMGTP
jgi:[ribosomal protein S5]-alanine N-acetyltransferase